MRAAAAAGCSTRRPRERWPRRKAFGRGSGPGAVRVRWLGAQMGRGWPGIRLGTRLCQSSQSAHKQRPTVRLRSSCVPVCGSCQTHEVPQCLCGFGEKFCHWLDCLPLHNTHAAARHACHFTTRMQQLHGLRPAGCRCRQTAAAPAPPPPPENGP